MPHAPSDLDGVSVDWHDYRETDLVLAFRPPGGRRHERRGFTGKPASKLYNAWHARVPAILGPDYAYREQRRSPLDYLEIKSPQEAQSAITLLKSNPKFYEAMVDNGVQRANEFTQEKILAQWAEILYGSVPQLSRTGTFRLFSSLPKPVRVQLRAAMRGLARRSSR